MKKYIALLIFAVLTCVLLVCIFSENKEDKNDSTLNTTETAVTEQTADEEDTDKDSGSASADDLETDSADTSDNAINSDDSMAGNQNIPEYSDKAFVELNNNIPEFTEEEKKCTDAFENYSELDSKGRCGVAFANLCKELMPTGERGEIGDVRPSGWHTVKYPDVIEDNYLYNRSHLIAFSLAGENANEKNLITGTRYLNQETMQIFELKVLDYLRATDNHVLYRVTPVFKADNLLADGVQMEAWSVEDEGKGICFNVFCYNVQPGIEIDYSTGDSKRMIDLSAPFEKSESEAPDRSAESDETSDQTVKSEGTSGAESKTDTGRNKENVEGSDDRHPDSGDRQPDENSEGGTFADTTRDYVVNTNSRRIHLPTCKSVGDMADKNKLEYTGTLNELKDKGYSPCGRCLADYR